MVYYHIDLDTKDPVILSKYLYSFSDLITVVSVNETLKGYHIILYGPQGLESYFTERDRGKKATGFLAQYKWILKRGQRAPKLVRSETTPSYPFI